MTATAGPGISLMSEFIGLGYYAEIPTVVFDVERVGPSTGLPTRTMQGDLLSTALLSHGDTRHPLLFPASVGECYSMAMEAFDLAEELQTPIFVMSDLDLGMNYWMSEAFPYPEKPLKRGKVLDAEDLERLGGFQRYKDVQGDGIGYRTLPGTNHPAAGYFTRGSGHNEDALYTEKGELYVRNMDRLDRKFETARRMVPRPVIEQAGHNIGLIAYGTTHWAAKECQDQLAREFGVETDYCRIRAFPFADEVAAFIRSHARVYVIEQNRDAQLLGLLHLALPPQGGEACRLRSVLHYDGLPIDARSITDSIMTQEVGN